MLEDVGQGEYYQHNDCLIKMEISAKIVKFKILDTAADYRLFNSWLQYVSNTCWFPGIRAYSFVPIYTEGI